MQIIPIRDLKVTVKGQQQCSENEQLEEAMLIARGLKDIEDGNVVANPGVLMNIKNKYGL